MLFRAIPKVAELLEKQIYETPFGGKTRGKFLISRDGLKDLLGVARLTTSILDELVDECLNRNIAFIDLDDCFAVVDEGFVRNFRKVPNSLVREFADALHVRRERD